MRSFACFTILLLVCAGDESGAKRVASPQLGSLEPPVATALSHVEFVPNVGQWDECVRFAALGGTTGWLHDDGFSLQLERWSPRDRSDVRSGHEQVGCVLRTRFVDAAGPEFVTAGASATQRHFFVGDRSRWRSHVPAFERVTMGALWRGIDVAFRPVAAGQQGVFEYDLLLAAGADLSRFRARVEGARGLRLDAAGRLCARLDLAGEAPDLIQEAPIAWQETPSGPRPVRVAFRLFGDDEYGFVAEALDPALATVVDPGVVWGTFLGGGASDRVNAMRWRENVGVWVAGWAGSTDFPTTVGAYRTTGGADAFVARLNDAGTALQFATYLGGGDREEVRGLDLGPGDTPTVVGYTRSTNFPITAAAFQPTYAGASLFIDIGDAFVVRLTAAGDAVTASTYLGGNFDDVAEAVAVDASGAAIVAGWTSSSTFPTTPGASQPNLVGIPGIQSDGFVSRVSANGQSLVSSTLVGGQLSDQFLAVELVPGSSDCVVAGVSGSFDYPSTPGVVRTTQSGGLDGIITRVNASATTRVWSTYWGALDLDTVTSLQVAANGTVWVGGFTYSTNYAVTPGAPQSLFAGQSDGFLAQISANAQSLLFSTLLGGPGLDRVRAIDVVGNRVIAVGEAGAGFPTTPDAEQVAFGGGNLDGFVTTYTTAGGTPAVSWSTYFGDVDQDAFGQVALANSGVAVVSGWSFSTDFPIAPATLQPNLLGVEDGVVMKLDLVSSFGDSLTVTSPTDDSAVVVAAAEHELLAATLTNLTPRDLVIDSVRVFIGGAGDAAQRLAGLRVWRDAGSAPATSTPVAGPLAVGVDNRELDIILAGCLVAANDSIVLRVTGDLLADPTGASAEVELAIVAAESWTLHAIGAGAGPTVRIAGPGRAEGRTLVLGALPGDHDGDGARTVVDVRALLAATGAPAGAVDTNGDGVVGSTDVAATTEAVLGRATVLDSPQLLQRGTWLTLRGVFPAPRAVQATLGGRSLTLGCATPRELTLWIAADQPPGAQELVLAVAGSVVVASLVDVQ